MELYIVVIILTFPLIVFFASPAGKNIKRLWSWIHRADRNFLIKLGFNCIPAIIVLSIVGLLVNTFNNFEALQYQWGIKRSIDTQKLIDYKFIRDAFVCFGALTGILYSFYIETIKNKPNKSV